MRRIRLPISSQHCSGTIRTHPVSQIVQHPASDQRHHAVAGFCVDLPRFAGSVAHWPEPDRGNVGRLSRTAQVDLDAEQRDRVVVDQLPDDHNCVHETTAGDQVAVVVSIGVDAE